MKIHMTSFARNRHKAESQFSHFDITEDELIQRVLENFECRMPGYRQGVVLVPVNPDGFWSSTAVLNDKDTIHGQFVSRREGEEPRKTLWIYGDKVPAKAVDIVLYSHEVLAENNDAESDAHYEIVSINAHPTVVNNVPMHAGTLMANHFGQSGGTSTKMSPEEFVETLRKSFEYWKDKIEVRPRPQF